MYCGGDNGIAKRGEFAGLQPTGARGDNCNPERMGDFSWVMRILALRAVVQTHQD